MSSPTHNHYLRSRKKMKKKSKKIFAKGTYCCDLCSYSTNIQDRMVHHIVRKHMGVKPFSCDLCIYKTSEHSDLKEHMSYHNDSPYECSDCDFVTTQAGILQNHLRIHTKDKPYGCDQCEYRCMHLQDLLDHIQSHKPEELEKCYMCETKDVSQQAFTVNKNGCRLCTEHAEASFRLTTLHLCALCQKNCIERWSYRRTTIHLTPGTRLFYYYKDGVLTCTICLRTFSAKIGYYSHMQAHSRKNKQTLATPVDCVDS